MFTVCCTNQAAHNARSCCPQALQWQLSRGVGADRVRGRIDETAMWRWFQLIPTGRAATRIHIKLEKGAHPPATITKNQTNCRECEGTGDSMDFHKIINSSVCISPSGFSLIGTVGWAPTFDFLMVSWPAGEKEWNGGKVSQSLVETYALDFILEKHYILARI